MELFTSLPAELQISLLIILPLFACMFALAYLMKQLDKRAKNYRVYWLLLAILGLSIGIADFIFSLQKSHPIYYRTGIFLTSAAYCYDRYKKMSRR